MMNERAFVNPRIHKSDQIDKILYSSRHLNTWHHAYRALSLYCLSKIVLSSNWHLEAIWGNAYDLHLAYKLNTLIQITHHSSFQPIQTSVDAPDTITDLPGRGTLRWKAWWFLRKSVMALELSGRHIHRCQRLLSLLGEYRWWRYQGYMIGHSATVLCGTSILHLM